ncbi:hypothetical protein COCNU_scaffold022151G000010 [Cocos nucifera]|nr:hypothetical protein [Cocos nucifera]
MLFCLIFVMLTIFSSFFIDLEMDIDTVERLTKGLYAQKKRKGEAPGGSSKRAKGKIVEAECLAEEKMAENENLRRALQKEELISTGLNAALALEEEKKKEADIKVTELKVKMSRSISEATA